MTDHPPGISRAGIAHADLLARIHAACFARGWSGEEFVSLMSVPGTWVLLASRSAGSDGPEPLGFIMMREAAGEAECLILCVLSAVRRGGVAKRLLAAALADSASCAQRVFLEVAADNDAAIALYAGAGFTEVGRRRAYYETGNGRVDALVLARDTAAPA